MKKLLSLAAALVLSLSMAGSVWAADMLEGTVTKVENGGREVMVKTKAGKTVTMSISGSRTKIEGIGDRSEFKAGQKVTAEMNGDEAKTVKVSKSK